MNILHISAQKPDSTGSGIYLTEVVRSISMLAPGVKQGVICGVSVDDEVCLPEDVAAYPVRFDTNELPFHVVGMSNEMPYSATKYRDLTPEMTTRFKEAFERVLTEAFSACEYTHVFCHHTYLVGAVVLHWVREHHPEVNVRVISHSTDLRQFKQIPLERAYIREGMQMADELLALHAAQADEMASLFGVSRERIRVVGSGYNKHIFYPPGPYYQVLYGPMQGEIIKSPAQKRAYQEIWAGPELLERYVVMRGAVDYIPPAPQRRRIVYAGKIGFKKGVMSLIQSLDYVGDEAFELVLCGGHSTQAEYDEIVAATQAFNDAEEQRVKRLQAERVRRGAATDDVAGTAGAGAATGVDAAGVTGATGAGDVAEASDEGSPGDIGGSASCVDTPDADEMTGVTGSEGAATGASAEESVEGVYEGAAGAAGVASAELTAHDVLPSRIVFRGKLSQVELAEEFRAADLFVLPSFFEGLPLVAIEAAACGCQVILTALPGLVEAFNSLAPDEVHFWQWVTPPRMHDTDEPDTSDLPRFERELGAALDHALFMLQIGDVDLCRALGIEPPEGYVADLEHLSWEGVAMRIFPELTA